MVRATAESSTSITVQWDRIARCRDINGLIVSYAVRYQSLPGGGEETAMVPGVWNMGGVATLTGLTPFTNYSIEVAAVNNQSDVGEFSEPVMTRTNEDSESRDECMRLVSVTLCHFSPSSPWPCWEHLTLQGFLPNTDQLGGA